MLVLKVLIIYGCINRFIAFSGYEAPTNGDLCSPVTCATAKCEADEVCVSRAIACVTSPCPQFICKPEECTADVCNHGECVEEVSGYSCNCAEGNSI